MTPTREYERVARVLKCIDPEEKRAVVFFHTSDNPYGNPRSVWSTIARGTRDFIKERFYGIATKTLSARFPKFNLKVHTLAPEDIPAEGSNYHIVDPAGGRNWFMLWVRSTPAAHYVYREWPGGYYIPGVGAPGPWAVPDGKRPDGARGPAQKPFGWGPEKYKKEIARLEGWTDYQEDQPADKNFTDWVTPWYAGHGAKERIVQRYMDCRFLNSHSSKPYGDKVDFTESEGGRELHELDMLGLHFTQASGDALNKGIEDINAALDYDETRAAGPFNRPRLFVSSECKNLIYALQTWTGLDGYRVTQDGEGISQKGATKDPIDVLRYFMREGVGYMEHVGGGQLRKPWGMK